MYRVPGVDRLLSFPFMTQMVKFLIICCSLYCKKTGKQHNHLGKGTTANHLHIDDFGDWPWIFLPCDFYERATLTVDHKTKTQRCIHF